MIILQQNCSAITVLSGEYINLSYTFHHAFINSVSPLPSPLYPPPHLPARCSFHSTYTRTRSSSPNLRVEKVYSLDVINATGLPLHGKPVEMIYTPKQNLSGAVLNLHKLIAAIAVVANFVSGQHIPAHRTIAAVERCVRLIAGVVVDRGVISAARSTHRCLQPATRTLA